MSKSPWRLADVAAFSHIKKAVKPLAMEEAGSQTLSNSMQRDFPY